MLRIQSTDDPKGNAVAYINSLLAGNVNSPILLMIAGGSAQEIVSSIDPELLNDQLTVTVTDERYTDDIVDNNFASLQGTSFYNNLISAGSYCIDTQIFSGENHNEHAVRFAKNLADWKRDFPNGKIIALFGVGRDGHIAGIIPNILSNDEFDQKFNNPNIWAVDLIATDNPHVERTSITFPFMKLIDFPLVYMVGSEKTDALAKITAKEGDLYTTPARVLNEMKEPIIFTDISIEKA
jgi:6-phosphogluconolactonase/glucosamine-6-phosphate isomerase/deaminase